MGMFRGEGDDPIWVSGGNESRKVVEGKAYPGQLYL